MISTDEKVHPAYRQTCFAFTVLALTENSEWGYNKLRRTCFSRENGGGFQSLGIAGKGLWHKGLSDYGFGCEMQLCPNNSLLSAGFQIFAYRVSAHKGCGTQYCNRLITACGIETTLHDT